MGVVPVTLLTLLTLSSAALGQHLRVPPTPGLTPAMVTYIGRTGEHLTVLPGDPATAAKLWKRVDVPIRGYGGCHPHLLAISLVRRDGRTPADDGVWWAVYSEGQYQPYFGGHGGYFCAHSLSWIDPATLRFDDEFGTF